MATPARAWRPRPFDDLNPLSANLGPFARWTASRPRRYGHALARRRSTGPSRRPGQVRRTPMLTHHLRASGTRVKRHVEILGAVGTGDSLVSKAARALPNRFLSVPSAVGDPSRMSPTRSDGKPSCDGVADRARPLGSSRPVGSSFHGPAVGRPSSLRLLQPTRFLEKIGWLLGRNRCCDGGRRCDVVPARIG